MGRRLSGWFGGEREREIFFAGTGTPDCPADTLLTAPTAAVTCMTFSCHADKTPCRVYIFMQTSDQFLSYTFRYVFGTGSRGSSTAAQNNTQVLIESVVLLLLICQVLGLSLSPKVGCNIQSSWLLSVTLGRYPDSTWNLFTTDSFCVLFISLFTNHPQFDAVCLEVVTVFIKWVMYTTQHFVTKEGDAVTSEHQRHTSPTVTRYMLSYFRLPLRGQREVPGSNLVSPDDHRACVLAIFLSPSTQMRERCLQLRQGHFLKHFH
jgi:hypothetical protein